VLGAHYCALLAVVYAAWEALPEQARAWEREVDALVALTMAAPSVPSTS
jgi:hypothetical protein